MAKKKVKNSKVIGSAIGGAIVPGMMPVQAHHYARDAGASRGVRTAAAAGGVVASVIPGGSIAGAIIGSHRSLQKQMGHKAYIAQGKAKNKSPRVNNDIDKAVARSKTSSSANTKNVQMHTRTKGRVGKK